MPVLEIVDRFGVQRKPRRFRVGPCKTPEEAMFAYDVPALGSVWFPGDGTTNKYECAEVRAKQDIDPHWWIIETSYRKVA